MAKQIKAAVIAALVVFVVAVTGGAAIGTFGTFALGTATTMAVMTFGTTLLGGLIGKMNSKEIKRDLLLFAKQNPSTFLALANDENVQLRNFAIKATEINIIKLSADQRTFTWGSNGKKLMTVPFDENPYSAFAAYLKTDEGVEVYKSIDKKIN